MVALLLELEEVAVAWLRFVDLIELLLVAAEDRCHFAPVQINLRPMSCLDRYFHFHCCHPMNYRIDLSRFLKFEGRY